MSRVEASLKKILDGMDFDIYKVYLFGSRAQGTNKPDSDYDFFIVLNGTYSREELLRLRIETKRALLRKFPSKDFDIIARNREDFERYSRVSSMIDESVAVEGKAL